MIRRCACGKLARTKGRTKAGETLYGASCLSCHRREQRVRQQPVIPHSAPLCACGQPRTYKGCTVTGIPKYGSACWPCRRAAQRIRRERGCCTVCQRHDHLQAHHADRNRSNNTDDNVVVLCVWCHRSVHADDAQQRLR